MLILSTILVQGLIVVGVLLLFFITFSLNRKTKAPKGVEVPEKCQTCVSNSCIIKLSDIDKIKEEMRKEIENCENGDTNETQ